MFENMVESMLVEGSCFGGRSWAKSFRAARHKWSQRLRLLFLGGVSVGLVFGLALGIFLRGLQCN